MSQQPNSVLANGENLAIGTGELNDVQSNNNSSKEQKDMVTTMTNNTNSTFVRKSINSKSLFVNEPLTQSETGDRLPIRDEMVAGLQLRIWDDLFCVVGQYGEGVFEVSLRTYEQITALITSLESLKVGKGTWRKGLHSHYNISDVEFVGDRIPSFAYVRFSRLSKADAKLLASHGIKDDGKHQDRWLSVPRRACSRHG